MAEMTRTKKQREWRVSSSVTREKNGTIKIVLELPWEEVKTSFEQHLEKVIVNTEIAGFRKGKAPREKVEQQVDRGKIYEAVIRELLPKAYAETLEDEEIKPVIYPKFHIEKAKEGENWQFSALTCEAPRVDLTNYKKRVNELLESKGKESRKRKTTESREEKEQRVLQALLAAVKVEVPDLLVEEEANYRMARLIEKTEKLGVTIDQYLSSIHKTQQGLRAEYAQEARRAIMIEVILSEIFLKEKLTVSDKEVERLIATSGDALIKKDLERPERKAAIRRVSARRAAFDYLVNQV